MHCSVVLAPASLLQAVLYELKPGEKVQLIKLKEFNMSAHPIYPMCGFLAAPCRA